MDREENPQKTLVIFGVEGFLGQQAYIQATSPEFQKTSYPKSELEF